MNHNQYERLALLAFVGEDELGSGVVGLKQGLAPAGYIPLVAIESHADRLEKIKPQMEAQARMYGKRIRLVRFIFAEVLYATEAGED